MLNISSENKYIFSSGSCAFIFLSQTVWDLFALRFHSRFCGSGLIADAAPGNHDSTVMKDSTFNL